MTTTRLYEVFSPPAANVAAGFFFELYAKSDLQIA
jgi:hypothetical protein